MNMSPECVKSWKPNSHLTTYWGASSADPRQHLWYHRVVAKRYQKRRKVMATYDIMHPKAYIDILYVPRKKGMTHTCRQFIT